MENSNREADCVILSKNAAYSQETIGACTTDQSNEQAIVLSPMNVSWRNTAPFPRHTPRRARHKIAKSFGIACVRRGASGCLEILLVKKRVSYAYNSFIRGHYNSSNSAEMIRMFSGMTNDEKQDILSLNFGYIWYRAWLDTTQSSAMYHTLRKKYENTFLPDNGAKLRRLMKLSHSSHRMWEIPKGRKRSAAESEINCAIREFAEETRITKSKYKLTTGTKQYSFTDDGVEYYNKYFIGLAIGPIILSVNLDDRSQSGEVSEVNWMKMSDVNLVDHDGHLTRAVREIFNYIRKNKLA